MDRRGFLMIIVLLVVLGLAMSIMLTIPREVRTLQRSQEQKIADSLVSIEAAVNAALRKEEFSYLMEGTSVSGYAGWTPLGIKSRYIAGGTAEIFLKKLEKLGYLVRPMYEPPIINGLKTTWEVMITEVDIPDNLMKYNAH